MPPFDFTRPGSFSVVTDFGTAAEVALRMEKSAAFSTDMMPALFQISEDMYRIEAEVFAKSGPRGGTKWKALKEDTVERKGSAEVLQGTARFGYGMGPGDYLKRSVTVPGAEFGILEFTSDVSVEFGTDVPWALVQQHGSDYNNRPARPFLRFLENDYHRWSRIIIDHIMRPFRVGGR